MTYLIDLASYMPHGNDLHRAILAALEARNGEEVRRQVVIDITTAAEAMMPLVGKSEQIVASDEHLLPARQANGNRCGGRLCTYTLFSPLPHFPSPACGRRCPT